MRVPHRRCSPQLSIATAIVFYHRFYSRKSYDSYDRFRIATTCLFLAGKVEETPKKIKDVVIEAYKAQHNKLTGPEPESKEFWALKEEILVCERILLQTLDFDLTVEHAYRRAVLPCAPRPTPLVPRLDNAGARPETAPGPTDGPGPAVQAAARLREEHQGHARLGAGRVELHKRQPAHDDCLAGALPPAASRRVGRLLSPRLSLVVPCPSPCPSPRSSLCRSPCRCGLPSASRPPPHEATSLRPQSTWARATPLAPRSLPRAVPAAMCGGVGGSPGVSLPRQQDGPPHASR